MRCVWFFYAFVSWMIPKLFIISSIFETSFCREKWRKRTMQKTMEGMSLQPFFKIICVPLVCRVTFSLVLLLLLGIFDVCFAINQHTIYIRLCVSFVFVQAWSSHIRPLERARVSHLHLTMSGDFSFHLHSSLLEEDFYPRHSGIPNVHRQISRTRCECIMGHQILSNTMMCSIAYYDNFYFVRWFVVWCCHWFDRAVLISFQHLEANIPFVIDGERGSMKNRYGYNWYERLKCWRIKNEEWRISPLWRIHRK